MKILIIGIDALEYNLVEKYNLKNIKQKEYGKIIVPLDRSNLPETPMVWGSFLSGNIYKKGFRYKNPLFKLITSIHKVKNKFIKKKFGILKFIRSTFDFLNISTHREFPKLNTNTFLNNTLSEYYNIPFYDFSNIFSRLLQPKINKYLQNKISYINFKNFIIDYFNKYEKKALNKIKKSKSNLFFCYFFTLDIIQHHFFKEKEFIKKSYIEMDKIVKKLKKLSKADFILIISDHGFDFKNKTHSKYGFYSSNKKLNLKNPKITDFYDIIMGKLNLPTRKEKKEIENKLKKLGYF